MSFLSGFAGAAAQTYDESSKGWKALFQEDARLEESARQEDARLAQSTQQEAARLEETKRQYNTSQEFAVAQARDRAKETARAFTQDEKEFNVNSGLEQARLDLAEGTRQDGQIEGLYDSILGALGGMSPEAQLKAYAGFAEVVEGHQVGGALATNMLSVISSHRYISEEEAIAGLNAAFARPFGELVMGPILDNYFEALSKEDQETYGPLIEMFKVRNFEEWEAAGETRAALDARAVAAADAEIAAREADAAQGQASAASILATTGIDVDSWGLNRQIVSNAITMSDIEVANAQVDGALYPAEAAARARSAIANAKTAEAQTAVAIGTVRAQIDTVVNGARIQAGNAGIVEEELRYALSTAGVREAILDFQAKEASLGPAERAATIAQIKAYTDVLDQQTIDSVFEREQASFDLIAGIVEAGNTDLLSAVGEDMLRLAFGDDWEEVYSKLETRAVTQGDRATRRVTAALIFEEANAEVAQYTADNIERTHAESRSDVQFEQGIQTAEVELRNRGMSVDEAQLAVNQGYLAVAQRDSALNWARDTRLANEKAREAAVGVPRNEILGEVGKTTDIRQGDLAILGSEIGGLTAALTTLQDLGAAYEGNPGDVQGILEGVTGMLSEYGIDVTNLQDAASIALAAEGVQRNILAKRENYIRSAGIFMANAQSYGGAYSPTAEELGLNLSITSDADLWDAINLQNGAVRSQWDSENVERSAILPDLTHIVRGFSPAMFLNGTVAVTTDAIEAIYNSAVENIGAAEMEAAGLDSPGAIEGLVRSTAATYQVARDTLAAEEAFLAHRGITLDFNNPQVLNAAAITMNTLADQANRIETDVLTLGQVDISQATLFGALAGQGDRVSNNSINRATEHTALVRGITSTYGVDSVVLMQAGFVTRIDNPGGEAYFVVTKPLELAEFLGEANPGFGRIAQALADLNNY